MTISFQIVVGCGRYLLLETRDFTELGSQLGRRNASARPRSAPASSQLKGRSGASGKRATILIATISANAAK